MVRCTQKIVCYVSVVSVMLMFVSRSYAVDRTRLISFNDSWQSASSWSPAGVPSANDRAIIDNGLTIRLSADTAPVNDLVVSNGSGLRTNGFRMNVGDNGGFAQTLIQGGGSWVRVNPRTAGGAALDSNEVILSGGGLLDMSGGEADIDFKLDIGAGSTVAGDGMIVISNMLPSGEPGAELDNNGTIRAEGGTLNISSTGGGLLELDGSSNTGILEAVDGIATLVIDDSEIFAGTMNIGAGNRIQFDQAWSTSIGTINFNTTGGTGTLSGSPYEHGGTINVNAGTARIDTPVDFGTNSIVNVAAGATLDFGTNVNTIRGTMNLNGGLTPALEAVIDGSFQNLQGDLNVSGQAKLDQAMLFESTSSINYSSGSSALRLKFGAAVAAGATFTGGGRLINLVDGQLTALDQADIDVPLENEGALRIATGIGQAQVESYQQSSTGSLEIELANITPGNFDVLEVQGNAILGGTLDVDLLNSFLPAPGNSFPILETVFGNVSGTFGTEDLPVFNGMTFDVVYNPQSVVLEVVESAGLDRDNDGDVDGTDFLRIQREDPLLIPAWESGYGSGVGSLSTLAETVPEPTTLTLIATSVAAAGARREATGLIP